MSSKITTGSGPSVSTETMSHKCFSSNCCMCSVSTLVCTTRTNSICTPSGDRKDPPGNRFCVLLCCEACMIALCVSESHSISVPVCRRSTDSVWFASVSRTTWTAHRSRLLLPGALWRCSSIAAMVTRMYSATHCKNKTTSSMNSMYCTQTVVRAVGIYLC